GSKFVFLGRDVSASRSFRTQQPFRGFDELHGRSGGPLGLVKWNFSFRTRLVVGNRLGELAGFPAQPWRRASEVRVPCEARKGCRLDQRQLVSSLIPLAPGSSRASSRRARSGLPLPVAPTETQALSTLAAMGHASGRDADHTYAARCCLKR